MVYEYFCPKHGSFEVRQPINADHIARCPQCGALGIRQFGAHEVVWAGSAYRPNGSRRQDEDYARLKG